MAISSVNRKIANIFKMILERQINGKDISVYCNNTLLKLLEVYREAVERHNTSVVIITDGRSGMGKTTLSNQMGIILDKNYNLENIYYEPEAFLEGLSNAKAGQFILFDEAMLISNRATTSAINRMVIQAMSMIRSKRIYVCFCVNSIFDLDRNLAISRADVLLHVYGENLISRGRFAAFFKAKDGFDRLKMLYLLGRKYYNYAKPKANFIGQFTKNFVVDEQEYERRKQIGVNNFLQGKSIDSGTRAKKQRDILIRHLKEKHNYSFQSLEELTGLRKQLYVICQKVQNE